MPRPEDSTWKSPSPRTPAPQIDQVFIWPTPDKNDFLFFVEKNGDLPINKRWKHGDPYPDQLAFPHHKLVYVGPQTVDKWSRWYYASDRLNQDEYNWEFTSADIGGNKFDAVSRTYLVSREAFDATSPALGSPMPNVPKDKFIGDYVLAGRVQQRTGEQELDSLYVLEKRIYIKRCTLTEILGSKLSLEERIYHEDELIGGVSVKDLFADPNNAFWEVQPDGSSRVGRQLSCDWYMITTQKELAVFFIWPTPNDQDYLFYVVRTANTPPTQTWNYGDTFDGDHPNHKLVYVSPVDEKGRSRFYYASDRINQDAYNWEFTSADIGGTKFNAVTRTYLTPRASFSETSPAMGSAMPNVPEDKFAGSYVLAERAQKRTGEQEFDSLYVVEQRTYIKRCTLTEIIGSKISKEESIYYKSEVVTGGLTAEELFNDPSNSYWGSQTNGITRTGKQLSCEWYLIVEDKELEVYFIWPTPNQADYLFYVVRNSTGNPATTAAYGSSYSGSGTYSQHKLVYVSPTDERGRSKFYYAAPRINEDAYNWQINAGKELIRTYVVLRANFAPAYDDVTDPDSQFNKYVFADETIIYEDEILNGLFIGVRKRYLQKETIDISWNADFESYIETKKEVKSKSDTETPSVEAGKIVEFQNENEYFKMKITRTLIREFPYEKPEIPGAEDYNFPNKLQSVTIVWAWAWADSVGSPRAYDEAESVEPVIKVPKAGPHKTRLRRWITDDPSALVTANPLDKIPVPQIETVYNVWSWFQASPKGNTARANVGSLQLPPTVHGEITVQETFPPTGVTGRRGFRTTTIPATPFFDVFNTKNEINFSYKVRQMDFMLYEFTLVIVDKSGLYD
jgi:hypothetical protein